MRKRLPVLILLSIPVVCLLSVALYSLPPVHSRLAWRLENLRTQVRYALNPPEQVVFVPQQGETTLIQNSAARATMDFIVQATLQALTPAPTQTALPTEPGPTATPQPSATPTVTPSPIPEKVILDGFRHEFQQMNNCGPTTLAMALSFWGWQGDQTDTRAILRPNYARIDDKNIMPGEMVIYTENYSAQKAITRVGGDLELLKSFIAAGFPVIIEKGLQDHPGDWMGHYALFTGYDDAAQQFITQDSYTGPGKNVKVPYERMQDGRWRDFNYVYLVIYPPERESEVMRLLGPQVDQEYNYRYAADKALAEIDQLTGRDRYFAWFNLGSNRVGLGDYAAAAEAFDQAFAIYPNISEDDRPWRMLWYRTEPYTAYYQTGRYQDVINLGNQTLDLVGKPILEETMFWLGMAREAQGELEKAITDYKTAVDINPNSTPALEQLQRLGVAYP
jgi:tetratricopeptide (TPR) repeat protein